MEEKHKKIIVYGIRLAAIACLVVGFIIFASTGLVMVNDPFNFNASTRWAMSGFFTFAGGMGLMILSAFLGRHLGLTPKVSTAGQRVAYRPGDFIRSTTASERVIIKEVVKVRCDYCGTLVDQGVDVCPHCGGRM